MRKALGVPRDTPVLLETKWVVAHFGATFRTARTQTARVPHTAWHSLHMPCVRYAERGDGASLQFPTSVWAHILLQVLYTYLLC